MSIDKLSPISYEYPKYSLEQGKIKDSVDAALLSFDSSCNLTNPLEADTIAFSSNSATNADVASQLRTELNKTKEEQGLIGKAWDGIKNLFGMKAGSDNVEKTIEKLENGEISQEEAQEVLTKYQDGQKMCVDVVGDMVSGIVAVGCTAAAPFTGGASLLVAAGAGAAVKVTIKGVDCAVGGRDYKLKDFGYDLITGSINGAMAPITNALGGVVGTGVAKVCGLNAGKVIVKETGEKVIEESVKQAGKSFLSNLLAKQGTEYIAKEGTKVGLKTTLATIAAYGADMAVDGGLGGATDGFARSLAEGDFENMGENVTQGFVGGLIAAPVIGGGFRLAGKAGSKVGSKLFGNTTANTVSSNAGDLTSGITGATAVSGLTIATRELSENVAEITIKEMGENITIASNQHKLIGKYNLDMELPVPNRKINSLTEINQDNIILTHLTHYLPQGGVIKTSLDAGGINRNTLHFALNHSVVNPLGAGGKLGWTDCEYSVLIPFKKALEQNSSIPYGGRHNDFIFVGSMQLPDGSFIIRQNKNLEDGVVEFFDAALKLDGYDATKNITLVETNMTPYEATDVLVEKLGYSNFKAMLAKGTGQSVDAYNIYNDVENFNKILNEMPESPTKEDWEELFKKMKLNTDSIESAKEFDKSWNDSWANFCKNFNYENCIDKDTIFAKNTSITLIIGCLDELNAGWIHGDTDYKEIILSTLKTLEENKYSDLLPYKPSAMYEIILNSETPRKASENLKKAIGLNTKINNASNIDIAVLEEEVERNLRQLLATEDESYYMNL